MVTTEPEFRLGREVRISTRRTGGAEQPRGGSPQSVQAGMLQSSREAFFVRNNLVTRTTGHVCPSTWCGLLIPCLPTVTHGYHRTVVRCVTGPDAGRYAMPRHMTQCCSDAALYAHSVVVNSRRAFDGRAMSNGRPEERSGRA